MMLRILAVVVALAAGSVHAQEVFHEDFTHLEHKKWEVNLGAVISGVICKPGTEEDKGELRLQNRGYLFTRQEFKDGGVVKLRWTWEDHGGGRAYADHLSVILRTTGTVSPEWSHKVQDGLRVNIDAGYGQVTIDLVENGENTKLAEMRIAGDAKKLEFLEDPEVPDNDEPLIASGQNGTNWYEVEVRDDGKTISVSINGKEVIRPVEYDASKLKGNRIGLSNREAVKTWKVSYVTYLTVDSLED